MRKIGVGLIFVLLALITGCSNNATKDMKILVNPGNTSDYKLDLSDDLKVDIVKTADGNNAFQLTCGDEDQAPSMVINDETRNWKMAGYRYLAADVTNTGEKAALVEIRLDANGWANQGLLIQPGQTRSVKSVIAQDSLPAYYRNKIIGMYNLPDGVILSDSKTDSIRKISFLIICPDNGTKVQISGIRAEEIIKYPSEEEISEGFFPIIDEFGQYSHTDWPLKTHSPDELKNSVKTEMDDINAHPGPENWDKYGGWIDGPQLKSTGHFRTQKVDGKWWLVDPEGHLFWSHGIGSVETGGGNGVITDREFYYSSLPDTVQYAKFYGKRRGAPFGYYKGKETMSFDQIKWNMMQKYGDDWKDIETGLIPKRLESWGQNTLGAWTSSDVYFNSKIPYTPIIMINPRRIEGSEGHWYKYSDPYDASLTNNLTEKIKGIENSTTDPYCIGYFVDNEITWGDSTAVARWTIASPADQPAKLAMLAFLQNRYKSINDLNENWHTQFVSWNGFLENTHALNIQNSDTKEFTLIAINEYFRKVSSIIKKLAPDKLYLGPRLDFHFYPSEKNLNNWDFRNNWIVNIAAQYCDVVSFNRYRLSARDLRPGDLDKPIIIGEWHHVPLEKGSFYMGPEHFNESLALRAEKYENFVMSCLNNPFIVGAHYFQYLDQPTIGRSDGENFSCGFLNICDRPYVEMVNVSRKLGNKLYEIRK
jgi:hypothetical protein